MDRGIRSANTVVNYLFLRVGPTIVEWVVMVLIFLFKVWSCMCATHESPRLTVWFHALCLRLPCTTQRSSTRRGLLSSHS